MLYETAYMPLESPTSSEKNDKKTQLITTSASVPQRTLLPTYAAILDKVRLWSTQPRFNTNLNFIHLIILLAIIPALVLSTLLPEQELIQNANRLGFFSVSLYIPVFLFATKKAPLPFLSSTSYISWNVLHRWLGRLIFVLGLSHGALWLHQYNQNNQLQAQLATAKVQRGIATLCFLFLLNISSLPIIRRHVYWLFFSLHVVGYVGALVLVFMHTPYAIPWVLYGAITVYALDLVIRFCALSTFTTASVTPLEDGMTQVWVHHVNSGWKAGQHVHLRIFSTPPASKGISKLLRPFESHPFTIAASASSDSLSSSATGFPLYVRSQGPGSWTGDLHSLKAGSTCFVHIEGPYGVSPFEKLTNADTLVLVAGGSGATWCLSMLDDIIARSLRCDDVQQLKKCFFVWSIQHQAQAAWFTEQIQTLLSKAREVGLDLDCRIFISRPASAASPMEQSSYLPETGCQISYATPETPHVDFKDLLEEAIADAINPCTSCRNCTCAHRPENGGCCPRDAEGCCQGQQQQQQQQCGTSTEALAEEKPQAKSCCGGKAKEALAAAEPKNVTWLDDEQTAVQLDPVLVRNGGMTLAVCGPRGMQVNSLVLFCSRRTLLLTSLILRQADARAAASRVPMRQIQRLGGLQVVTEAFCV